MGASVRSCAFLAVLLFVNSALAHQATPIETVINLLEGLTSKVTEDGKNEAAAYDKFACWCKEQADNKQYANEKSTKLIAALEAEKGKLDAEIAKVDGEILTLGQKITSNEEAKQAEIEARARGKAAFESEVALLEEGIAAVKGAILEMQKAKGNLVDAKVTGTALIQKIKPYLTNVAPEKVSLLAKLDQPLGAAVKYQYQGNDILDSLADIVQVFKAELKKDENAEFEAQKQSNVAVQGYMQKIKFATKAKAEKSEVVAGMKEEVADVNAELAEEKRAIAADAEFLEVLKTECEKKAEVWDLRSKTRADELQALSQATETLKEGALDNFQANKKLVGLQKSAKPSIKPHFFLQLRGSQHHASSSSAVVAKVQVLLAKAATRLKSTMLTSTAMRVLVQKDHFVKVRGLIKDLIAKAEADATSEADQKSLCDDQMESSIESRDTETKNIEGESADIDTFESKIAKLTNENTDLSKEISDLNSALLDATDIRETEKTNNQKTIDMATQGKEAVASAIEVLEKFYNTASQLALVQKQKKYVPPNADRSGKAMGDYREEVFTSTYKGEQQASTGIIGMLQTILSDFERTEETTNTQEEEAEEDFKTFKKETEDDIKAKDETIKAKDLEIKTATDNLVAAKGNLKDADEKKELALKSLDTLRVSCVDGEETYAERVQKREEEIAALKEALQILIDWNGD